jgi:hypothetical protein
MNATQQIEIVSKNHEETGWKRYIRFNYEGEENEVFLFWNEFDGYELCWLPLSKTPDWAVNWDEQAHNNQSLESYLDDLTWKDK